MKTLLTVLILGLSAVARAGTYYDLQQTASSATMKLGGVMKLGATTSAAPSITVDGLAGAVTATSAQWGTAPSSTATATSTGGLKMADSLVITGSNKQVQVAGTNATIQATGPGTTNLKVLNSVGDEGLVINHTQGQVNTLFTPYNSAVASPSLSLGSDGFKYDTMGITACDASGGWRGNGVASIGFNTPAPNSGSGYPTSGGSCYGGSSFTPDGPQVWFNNNTTVFGYNQQPSHPNGIVFIGMSQDPLNHPNISGETSGSSNRYGLYFAPSFVVDDSGNAYHHFGLKVDAVEAVSTTTVVKSLTDQSGIFVGDGQIYSPASNLTIGTRYGVWVGTQVIGSVNYGFYDQSNLVVEDYAKFDGKVLANNIVAWGPAATRSTMTATGGINTIDDIVLTKASGLIQAHGTNATITANGPGTQNVKVLNDAGNEGVVINHTQGQSYTKFDEYNGGVISPGGIVLDGGATGNAGIGTTVLPSSWTVNGSMSWGMNGNTSTGTVTGGLNLADSIVATKTGVNIQASGTNATVQATGPGTTNLKVLNNAGNEGLVINHTSGQSYTLLQEYNSSVASPASLTLDGGATGNVGLGTTVMPSSFTINGSMSWGMNGNTSSGTVAGALNLAGALTAPSANINGVLYSSNTAANATYSFITYTGSAKTSTSGQNILQLGRTNEPTNYAAIQLGYTGAASNTARVWNIGTVDQGIANAGIIAIQSSGGSLSVGTTASTSTFNVGGQITQSVLSCTTGIQTSSLGTMSSCVASDRRLKRAIKSLKYEDGLFDRLRPVTYRWKDTATRDAQEHQGFIAQEVGALYPDAMVDAGKDTKGIDSNALIAVLVQEVQALRKRVAALEAK